MQGIGAKMLKEIIKLHEMGLGKKKIARSLQISVTTVKKYLAEKNNSELKGVERYQAPWASEILWTDLRRRTAEKGFALSDCFEELKQDYSGLREVPYVSFWREYRRRYPEVPLEWHKVYHPGERCEVDYKGKDVELEYYDSQSAKMIKCRLFGAVLCFSSYLYARATHTENREDMLPCIAKAFEYFCGAPETLAFDNTRVAVDRADRYDPDINHEFQLFCEHYLVAPLAMRPLSPKDKAVIENSLGVFWRWIRPQLRQLRFFSLGGVNDFLKERLSVFNERVQRKYATSRKNKFVHGEKDLLKSLPEIAYSWGEWRKAKVHPDCHVQVIKNFYSVPYRLRGQEVDVRISGKNIEIFSGTERFAIHTKISPCNHGRYVTHTEHLPEKHLAMLDATPQNILQQAAFTGVNTSAIIEAMFANAMHPLQHLRRAQGVLRLKNRYSKELLEESCRKVIDLNISSPRLRDIEQIIKQLRQHNYLQDTTGVITIERQVNSNLRGQNHWKIN